MRVAFVINCSLTFHWRSLQLSGGYHKLSMVKFLVDVLNLLKSWVNMVTLMPRNYHRNLRRKPYVKHTFENLDKAIKSIKSSKSIWEAASKYKIPLFCPPNDVWETLNIRSHGHQNVLSPDVELPQTTLRLVQSIQWPRAAVSRPTHFEHYDETNLTDDPGRFKAIIKWGSRYPERLWTGCNPPVQSCIHC